MGVYKIRKDLVGKKFSKLLVLNFTGLDKNNNAIWLCRCMCGNKIKTSSSRLVRKHTKSCGCTRREKTIKRNTKHGLAKTRFYNIWCSIKSRTLGKTKFYEQVKLCKRWNKFENFYEDMYKSYLNKVSKVGEKNTTIDRVNTAGNYTPSNCRWASYKEQQNNRKDNLLIEFRGETKNSTQWAEDLGMSRRRVVYRFKKGLPLDHSFK